MSEKRKRIFKDALFIVPFMLVTVIVSIIMMFVVGRDVFDMMTIVKENTTSDKTMDISEYTEMQSNKYSLSYYYGDRESSVEYATYSYNAKGDYPIETLELKESRDGFEPGIYKIEWYMQQEFVSYTSNDSAAEPGLYPASEQPYMCEYVRSYSWSGMLEEFGIDNDMAKGYKVLKFISAYVWDTSERENILLGLGGNPTNMYSYRMDKPGEYRKVTVTNR